jgi:hypothetical protein
MGLKFDKIFESVISRYQVGGFLTGDTVKFRSNYKSSPTYKAMHPKMQKDLDELIKSGLNINVTQIGDKLSGASAGNQFKTADNIVVTVAADQGGGRRYGQITVPAEMLELVENDGNYSPVPDQWKRKDKITIKPEKVVDDPKNITRVTDKGTGKNTPTQLKLGESTNSKNDMNSLATLLEEIL